MAVFPQDISRADSKSAMSDLYREALRATLMQ